MAKSLTDIRCGKEFRLGVAVQDEEGSAAASPMETLWASGAEPDYGREVEDISGSYGRVSKPHYARINTAFAPTISCTFAPTRKMLPILLRAGYGKGTVSEYTKTGDVDNELSNIVLNGIVPEYNTDAANKVYLVLTNPSGTVYKVEVYSDVGLTNKIAEGQADYPGGSGTITLAEVNNSGVSGTVDVSWTDGESGVEVEIGQIEYDYLDNIFEKYLTLWWDDGKKMLVFSDCTISEMRIYSTEKTILRIDATFVSKGVPVEGVAGTISLPSVFDIYCHNKMDLIKDPSGTPVEYAVSEFEVTLTNEVDVFQANSLYPCKLIKKSFTIHSGSLTSRWSEEMWDLFNKGIAEPIEFVILRGRFSLYGESIATPIYLTLDMDKVHFTGNPPTFTDGNFDDYTTEFEALGNPDALKIIVDLKHIP